MTGVICRVVTPKDKERYPSPLTRKKQYYFYLKGFINVNVRWSVIYLLHRWSQNSSVTTELLRWRVWHFDVGSVMSLIKSSIIIYSGYEVKLFMERYSISNNWHENSFSTLHFFKSLMNFPWCLTKRLSCKIK